MIRVNSALCQPVDLRNGVLATAIVTLDPRQPNPVLALVVRPLLAE